MIRDFAFGCLITESDSGFMDSVSVLRMDGIIVKINHYTFFNGPISAGFRVKKLIVGWSNTSPDLSCKYILRDRHDYSVCHSQTLRKCVETLLITFTLNGKMVCNWSLFSFQQHHPMEKALSQSG